MSDMKESLVMMREMARTRIQMLREGVTLHKDDRKSFYIGEYEAKVRELDHQIRRMSLRLVRGNADPDRRLVPGPFHKLAD